MYGSVFRLRPQDGRESDVVALMEEWNRSRGPKVRGARATYLLRSERRSGELIGIAVFDDHATYQKNAESPEQDAWYRRIREVLQDDPVWEDGTFLVAEQFATAASAG